MACSTLQQIHGSRRDHPVCQRSPHIQIRVPSPDANEQVLVSTLATGNCCFPSMVGYVLPKCAEEGKGVEINVGGTVEAKVSSSQLFSEGASCVLFD